MKQLMMTLALLLTAATGAWAQDTYTVQFSANNKTVTMKNVTLPHKFSCNRANNGAGIGDGELDQIIQNLYDCYYGWCSSAAAPTASGNSNVSAGKEGNYHFIEISAPFEGTATVTGSYVNYDANEIFTYSLEISIPDYVAGTVFPITWSATSPNTASIEAMPAGNVTVSVEYYPQATADGAVTAATDAKATTDAPLVTVDETMLTGAAKMMYYVSTSTTAPAYDAEGWTDVLPTAEKYTEAANLNVWYYPVGTDEGVDGATATYSDGDMNATALAVSLGDAPTYNVEFAEGTNPEAPAEPIWTASPNTDVKKGQTVTVTYTGQRKVIGVKAEKKATKLTITIPATANAAALTLDVTGCTTWEQILNQNITTLDYEGDGVYGQTSECYILDGNNNRLRLNTPYDPTTNYHWGTQK